MKTIHVNASGSDFITGASGGTRFTVWGVNYDHDRIGRLLEDYWIDEWATVVHDFQEIKALDANVVRIHLQLGKFMESAEAPNEDALRQLAAVVSLAERTGLYLDITGLACYHKPDVPGWYDALPESERWDVQARFWEAIAEIGKGSPAIFCYDLMNEPILPGKNKPETEWLAGEFAGNYFVQRIALDLAGRSQKQVAHLWVDRLVMAIRKHDPNRLITVGVIPWAHTFPKAKPIFYDPGVAQNLDFVSVHFYPRAGEVDAALAALKVYDIGKPLVVEETFPLKCSIDEMDTFIGQASEVADGFIGFYWGKTIAEYAESDASATPDLTKNWLEYFQNRAPEMTLR